MRRQPHRRFAQRANRYIGMLHDCLHTRQIYDPATALAHWPPRARVASTKVVYEPVRSGVSLPND